MGAILFGYLPKPYKIESGDVRIHPRPNFRSAVARVGVSELVKDGWIYPPMNRRGPDPSLRFTLPMTHQLVHRRSGSENRLFNLITVIGFLLGYRLVPQGHGHLQRVPMRPSRVTDLFTTVSELARALPIVDAKWISLPREDRRLLLSAIHAYQWGTACAHDFEVLAFLYAALDAIYLFHFPQARQPGQLGHWQRARDLCQKTLRIPTPVWARGLRRPRGAKKRSGLSKARNELVHEALFAGAPLGYAVETNPMNIEVQGVVSRAIVAALGINCAYIRTPVTTRQMQGLDLI